MTKEEKQLLLKDLCARLPYGVIVQDRNGIHILTPGNTELGTEYIKPFLRPMSSMTKEEKEFIYNGHIEFWVIEDYCNKYHLDYRGLIEKGLALEALEGMYEIE